MIDHKIRKFYDRLALGYYRAFKSWKTFALNGRRYRYCYRLYNYTWRTERCVEIPIIMDRVRKYDSNDILEFGNVLSYYFPVSHDILDKNDPSSGAIQRDVLDFRTDKRYRLIVSISSLEHVGFTEDPRDADTAGIKPDAAKLLAAIDVLKKHLAPGGRLVATVPLGYNGALDKLWPDQIKVDAMSCLKRVSADNRWVQAPFEEVIPLKYGEPFAFANGIIVFMIQNKE